MSVKQPGLYSEHDIFGRHTNEMATARVQPKILLERHREFLRPKVRRIPNTTVFGQIFEGSPAQTEGLEGRMTLINAPLYQEQLAIRIKYAFKDGSGGGPAGSKSAFFQMNYRAIRVNQNLVSPAKSPFTPSTPVYIYTSIGALLYQASLVGTSPPQYPHRENLQMLIPGRLFEDSDFIIIEDFFRDTNHPEDSGDNVFIIDVDVVAIPRELEEEDMFMFEGEVLNVAVGASATVNTPVTIDVPSPDVFSKKGILRHIEVVASSPPGASTDFDVSVYADASYTKLLYSSTGHTSASSPYGLLTREEQVIFKNEDSPQEKKLYVRIEENSGNATNFDIRLKGGELK